MQFTQKTPILFMLFILLFGGKAAIAQNVAINTTGNPANPNAMLDISANDKGLLIPRLSTAQRTGMAIGGAEEGLTVYDTDTQSYWLWDGTSWVEFDMDASNEYNISFTLTGNTLEITDAGGTLTADLSAFDDNTDNDSVVGNEYNTGLTLNGNTLELTDGGGTLNQDLSALIDDADADPTNEYNTSVNLNGTTLEITDGGGTLTQDLSSLSNPGYWDRDVTNGWLYPSNIGDDVGIGDADPESKLDVHGRTYIGGNMDAMTDNGAEIDLAIDDDEAGSNTGFEVPGNDTLTFIAGGAEQARIFPDGVMAVNTQAVVNNQTFYSVATGNDNAVLGLVGGSGAAVQGESLGGTGPGVVGIGDHAQSFGLYGINNDASGTGLIAVGNGIGGTYLTNGSGASVSGTRFGGIGWGDNASDGIGLFGAGNGQGVTSPTSGAGVAGLGESFGVWGRSDSVPGGIGVIGTGNGVGTQILTDGAGVGGSGDLTGVYGFASDLTDGFGGYFQVDASSYSYVGGYFGGTAYKIIGPGAVSTIVEDEDEEDVTMFAPEAPEVLFEDYGQGKLEDGEARIELDPTWKRNVRIDEEHPLRVFVQVEGNCKGVYVAEKGPDGFIVKELDNGNSDAPFTYKVVANRKDEEVPTRNGGTRTIRYEDLRFPDAPEPKKFREGETEKHERGEGAKPRGSGLEKR